MKHKGLVIGIIIVLVLLVILGIWYFSKSKEQNNVSITPSQQIGFTFCQLFKDQSVSPIKYFKKMCNNQDCNEGFVSKQDVTLPIQANCNYVQIEKQEYAALGGTV